MSAEETPIIGRVDTYIDPEQLKQDMHIDKNDLQTAMLKHAGLYTHYAIAAAKAVAQHDRWKSRVEVIRSILDTRYRKSLAEQSDSKVTEGMVAAAVNNDKSMRAAQNMLLEAKQVKELCENAVLAFIHRKDMLLQLARDAAAERAGDLRILGGAMGGSARERLLALIDEKGKASS